MARATRVIPADVAAPEPFDAVVLDWDRRHRRRLSLTTRGGLSFLLDLAAARALRAGDRLVLEDGRTVAVEAEPEPLAAITAADTASLVRIAWHLGNRHLPTQLSGDRLLIRRDHVIEAMVAHLGGQVERIEAPFDPEGGAYGHGRHHHHHDHDHDHHGEDGARTPADARG